MPSIEDTVAQEAVILCNEYIHHKLRQLGLIRKGRTVVKTNSKPGNTTSTANTTSTTTAATISSIPLTTPSKVNGHPQHQRQRPPGLSILDTILELQRVGAELERLYPSLFRDVFNQLNIPRVSSEEVVEEAFTAVSDEIFRTGVTWARVVAMFAVAGALAVECVQQRNYDHAVFVDRLIGSLTRFVRERLVIWIAGQGGWGDMSKTFRGTKDDDSFVLMAIGVLGALCGFAGTIFATGKLQEVL